MGIASTAQRIRDSGSATVIAIVAVVLAQIPIVAAFTDIPMGGKSYIDAITRWMLGAGVWTAYTVVHLLAPLAGVRSHPNRESWGPSRTVNVYTYASVRQIWIRLSHGILGFIVCVLGIVVFVSNPPLLVFPVAVMILTVVLMSAHVGIKDPPEETQRHL